MSIIAPPIKPKTHHCCHARLARVRSQYQMNRATTNADCACDQEGLKYMYTGRELASQIPTTAKNAHRSGKYFRVSRKEIKRQANPQKAVTTAMVSRYGHE